MTAKSCLVAGSTALCLSLAALSASTAAAAEPSAAPRVTQSKYYARDGREQQVPDRISRDEADSGSAGKSGRRSAQQKGTAARSSATNTEFWFYTVDVELFADEDRDGYYHGVDLYFDADTIYEQADVYAVLYLSRDGGPWYEYAATDVFPLYGATSDDDFVVESELLSGWPKGSYDLLIELYDTWDDALVAEIGPESSAELAYLPLEDADRDTPPPDVIVVDEGGGAADPLTLALFGVTLGVLLIRRRRLRPAPARGRRGPYA